MEESLPPPLSSPRLVGSRARPECRAISSRIAREYVVVSGERGEHKGEFYCLKVMWAGG